MDTILDLSPDLSPDLGRDLGRDLGPDLDVDGKVVAEGKTVDRPKEGHGAQVNSYLRFSGPEVGVANTKA